MTSYQSRVKLWLVACFGRLTPFDREDRAYRFLEEALELAQACGVGEDGVIDMLTNVYGRTPGHGPQEVGGVMVTLAGLCTANDWDMEREAEHELTMNWSKLDEIREKAKTKPKPGEMS